MVWRVERALQMPQSTYIAGVFGETSFHRRLARAMPRSLIVRNFFFPIPQRRWPLPLALVTKVKTPNERCRLCGPFDLSSGPCSLELWALIFIDLWVPETLNQGAGRVRATSFSLYLLQGVIKKHQRGF